MSLKRRILHALDVPWGRSILASIATWRARRLLGRSDVEVACRGGLWVHRLGSYVIPDGTRFEYHDGQIRSWPDQIPKYLRNAEDYWFGLYTPAPGDVIVDVGAGRGEDVLAFAQRVGATGRVLAVEANPTSFRLLSAFCAMNALDNVTVLNVALMDAPGAVTIEDVGDWRKHTVGKPSGGHGTVVPATTLDALCRDHGIDEIAFLKMNIEGAERLAVPGMGRSLDRIHRLCVCCHDFRADRGDGEQYRTRRFVEQFLAGRGFSVVATSGDRRAYVRDHLHARRRASGTGG